MLKKKKDALQEPRVQEVMINEGEGRKMKAYLLFGEHPREMISPETGLNFIRELCYNPTSEKNS
jgi:hypothetical protein